MATKSRKPHLEATLLYQLPPQVKKYNNSAILTLDNLKDLTLQQIDNVLQLDSEEKRKIK